MVEEVVLEVEDDVLEEDVLVWCFFVKLIGFAVSKVKEWNEVVDTAA